MTVNQDFERAFPVHVEDARPNGALLQRLADEIGAAHASLFRHDGDDGHTTVTDVVGKPFVAPGMTVRMSKDVGTLAAAPRYANGAPPLALTLLAQVSGIDDLTLTSIPRADGLTTALLALGWHADAERPASDVLAATVERALPAFAEAAVDDQLAHERIVVAHEDELVADGLARRVERERAARVTACSTGAELRAILTSDKVSILLCGDRLADGTSLSTVVDLARSMESSTRVVAIGRTATARTAAQAKAAGAHGCVALSAAATEMLSVLRSIRSCSEPVVAPTADPAPPALTGRELDLLRGLDEGLSYQQIARELGLALSTVKTQSRPLFRKLGVSSRAAAVHQAREEGLL